MIIKEVFHCFCELHVLMKRLSGKTGCVESLFGLPNESLHPKLIAVNQRSTPLHSSLHMQYGMHHVLAQPHSILLIAKDMFLVQSIDIVGALAELHEILSCKRRTTIKFNEPGKVCNAAQVLIRNMTLKRE